MAKEKDDEHEQEMAAHFDGGAAETDKPVH